MAPVRITPAELARHLPRKGRVLVLGCAGESRLLADAVMAAGDTLGDLIFTGIFIPGINRHDYLAHSGCRVETFFYTPEIKAAPSEQVMFLPLCYNDIRARLQQVQIDAALMMVAPPDADGYCSFGNSVDFLAELWPEIPVLIAHVNPAIPRTTGYDRVPFDRISAYVEAEVPLVTVDDTAVDPVAEQIAGHIAPYIGDGATLQAGLGKVPGAVMRALTGRRGLKIHSGLVVDSVIDLLDAGALADGAAIVAGCAIGSDRLYRRLDDPAFRFCPVAVTHDPMAIAAYSDFIAINSAIEVDILGQSYAELGPKGLMSGPGGASDYARGARMSPGGIRIVALAASAARGTIEPDCRAQCGCWPGVVEPLGHGYCRDRTWCRRFARTDPSGTRRGADRHRAPRSSRHADCRMAGVRQSPVTPQARLRLAAGFFCDVDCAIASLCS